MTRPQHYGWSSKVFLAAPEAVIVKSSSHCLKATGGKDWLAFPFSGGGFLRVASCLIGSHPLGLPGVFARLWGEPQSSCAPISDCDASGRPVWLDSVLSNLL